MDLRKGFATALLATFIVTPAAMAHDPRMQELEEQMERVPVQIQSVPVQIQSVPVPAPKPELPKIRFSEMDSNGDRKITRKEWRGKASAFRKLDKNKDGVLSGVEVEVPVKAQPK